MAKLYEFNKEAAPGELTQSLAQSLKNGLFAPTEKKFNALEREIALLKRLFRISIALSITCLAGLVITLVFLFSWY